MKVTKEQLAHRGLFTVLAITAALAMSAMIDGGALAEWIAFDAIPFLAFWVSAAMLVAVTAKAFAKSTSRNAEGSCIRVVLTVLLTAAALAIVVLYTHFVIAPVVAMPGAEQTGIGCIWLISSIIAVMIALPLAAGLVESL